MGTAQALAPMLSEHYTVFAYDRRGRGESGPGLSPYAVHREVEDLVAVLEAAGPDAFLIGASSGAVLVLEALRAGVSVRMVVLYEAPFIVDNTHAPNDANLGAQTQQLIAASRPGDAVKLFMRVCHECDREVGM
jgi:pimeloyl-ACP methyl ester carboxylesterase